MTEYLEPDDALAAIEQARKLNIKVLGLEGLVLSEGSTRPTSDVADFSAASHGSHDDAIAFVNGTRTQVTHYDVTFDN